ncbi:CPBP family intramembrane glutamic endopeptidase [Actinocorallia populi]|uniref:CPBP family intramembrane glutamic endopeptidase n=1 Tax=Actinocorallia populi TaxID=2079200 RepID=UPI000D0926FC|nr:CPBP family intramembrane glutamic endopeptidase [Actinocorallia populi]
MEPPSATPPSGPDEPGRDEPAEAPREEPPAPWQPPDSGRPDFAPPQPQAAWPAEHTYPVRSAEQPPPPAGPAPTPTAPGYLLPGQVAPGAGPATGPFQAYPGYAPQGPGTPGQPAPPGYETLPSGYAPGQPYPGFPPGHVQGQPVPPGYGAVPSGYAPGQPYPGFPPGHPVPGSPPYGYAVPRRSSVVPAPPGTPFHQQDRTERHRWWRPLLGTAALLAGVFFLVIVVFVGWMVGHALVTGELPEPAAEGDQLVGGPLEDLALQLVMLGVLIPLVPLAVWIFSRRPMGTVISVLGRMRWRWLGACALAALVYVAVSLVTGMIVTAVFTDDEPLVGEWVGWSAFWAPALVILLLVPFQSSAEEFVFRGWLLQAIGGCTLRRPDGSHRNALTRVLGRAFGTPWPAILISSALFVAGHGYRTWAMVDIFLWAVACGWLAVKTGGLEAPIALHVLNNLLAFGVTAAAGDLEDSLQQGAAPWYYLLSDMPPLIVFVVLVLWLRRRMNIATVTPG